MDKKLYVLCGPPASGKSTWAREHKEDMVIISRDEIRFSMLRVNEDYFAHEDEVLERFYDSINCNLEDYTRPVVADATHLSVKARRTFLANILGKENIDIIAVSFETPWQECSNRNAMRKGRARVPETALYKMYKAFRYPTTEEGFSEVIHVKGDEFKK